MAREEGYPAAVIASEARSLRSVSDWFTRYGFADVHDHLLVGAYPLDSRDVSTLAHIGVRRVLNLTEDVEYPQGARAAVQDALRAAAIEEHRVRFGDFGHLPADSLERAVSLVEAWLREGELAYLHCRAGRQRSAAVAAGALAFAEGLSIDDALREVRRRKPTAEPLAHQIVDLRAWWAARNGAGAARQPLRD